MEDLGGFKIKQDKPKKCADYKQGKIYAIRSPHTKYYYVGSTTEKYLSQRLTRHKSDFNSYMSKSNDKSYMYSFYIIEQGDSYIELIENYACNDAHELKAREGHFIREDEDNVCNKYVAGGHPKSHYCKTYRDKKKRKQLEEQIEENKKKITELEKQQQ